MTRRAHIPAKPTVLVVEDDPILAVDFADTLRAVGFRVMGPFAGVEDARAALDTQPRSIPDFACLDIQTEDGLSLGLARDLLARGVRTTFVTGQGDLARLSGTAGAGILDKPVMPTEVDAHFAPLVALWRREAAEPAKPEPAKSEPAKRTSA